MAPIRMVLRSKIHRATVTQADLDYVGSISIDEGLMEAAGIVEWEKIAVLDITNGSRLETYAIKAPRGSGEICINCLLYTSPSPRDRTRSRMPSSA